MLPLHRPAVRLAAIAMFALVASFPAYADSLSGKLDKVQQQRAELKQAREHLEARLGALGQVLKKADVALVEANAELRKAEQAVRAMDVRIAGLQQRQSALQAKMHSLQQHMQREAALAWQKSGRTSLWLDMLLDSQVAEIPHRQYLLSRLVQQQQQDRQAYAEARKQLVETVQELQVRRQQLDALRAASEARRQGLLQAREEKQALWDRVRHDARLKAERDRQLSLQEEELKKLLSGAGSTLLNSDNADDWKPMRLQKGRLPWPMDGRIVAAFHSPTAPGRPSLAGVQLAPRRDGGQVKAIASGQVRYAGWFGGYGLMLIVDHGDGLMTVYAHNNALYKQVGDWVAPGDVLADAGSTGWVKSTLLYFEVRDSGRPVNPRRWCRKKG